MTVQAIPLDCRIGSCVHRAPALAGVAWWAELRSWWRTASMSAGGAGSGVTAASDALDQIDIQASVGGDGQAYARLIRRYQSAVAAYLWRFARNRGDRDELVHDVFVEAYFSLRKYAGRASLLFWLKRIATRIGYRYWKNRRRESPLPSQLAAPADSADSASQAAELVHRLLAQLAPRDRLVMTLTCLEGCTVAETAKLTGWTQTMVKVQAYRARQRLVKICRHMGIEP